MSTTEQIGSGVHPARCCSATATRSGAPRLTRWPEPRTPVPGADPTHPTGNDRGQAALI